MVSAMAGFIAYALRRMHSTVAHTFNLSHLHVYINKVSTRELLSELVEYLWTTAHFSSEFRHDADHFDDTDLLVRCLA